MAIVLSSKDVLIVDDDPEVVDVFKMYLEETSMFRHIIVAKDGVEASVKLTNQVFSVIILDYNLPKKNGLEIIKHLKDSKDEQLSRVIFISGQLDKFVLQSALGLGVKHFLVKPFDKQMFVDKINLLIK